jgi:hypothetical protein
MKMTIVAVARCGRDVHFVGVDHDTRKFGPCLQSFFEKGSKQAPCS